MKLMGMAGGGVLGYQMLQKFQEVNKRDLTCEEECPEQTECVYGLCDCMEGKSSKKHIEVRVQRLLIHI